MRQSKIGTHSIKCIVLAAVLGLVSQSHAQDPAPHYPHMLPIDQYLMTDREAEVALARRAAPQSVSQDAEILILGRHGFETAVKGKNGFTCAVTRSWTSAPDPDFWDPKVRVPMCFNAPAARSYLIRFIKITDLVLSGQTKDQIDAAVAAGVEKKELPSVEPGAMCYMMSKEGFGGDTAPHWPPHLMFFYSQFDMAAWGANLPGSPVLGVSDPSEQLTQFVVPVQLWSDGTAYHGDSAHEHHHH